MKQESGQILKKVIRKSLKFGLSRQGKFIILGSLSLLSFLFFRDFLFILIAIAIGGLSMWYQLVSRSYVAIELSALVTVFMGMTYSWKVGAFVGLMSQILAAILKYDTHPLLLIQLVGYSFIGIVASFFPISSFFVVGFILVVLYDLVAVPIYFFTGSNPIETTSYAVTHVLSSFFIFRKAAEYLPYFV